MTGNHLPCGFKSILLAGLVFFSTVAVAGETVKTVRPVIHPGINTDHLSRNLLRSIFGMRLRTWQDGLPVRVFVLPDDAPIHGIFTKQQLNIFPYQLRAGWDRLTFTGTGQAPIIVQSEDEMYSLVASTPGAIGYLSEARIDKHVRVIHVD